MDGDDLRFSCAPVADRRALLLDAARRVDALEGHLGKHSADPQRDGHGDLLRALAEDNVEFGAHPDLYRIAVPKSSGGDAASAQPLIALGANYTFWWLRIPVLLFPRRNWAFTRLEVGIEFNPDEEARIRPKAYDILPNRRFDTIMQVGTEVTVKLGADVHFSVDTGNLQLPAGLPVEAETGVKVLTDVGGEISLGIRVKYRAAAARVNHTSEGLPKVLWRLDGAEFFQESPPALIVILQVPNEAAVVKMLGEMYAYRQFTMFPARLQTLIRELPEALRAFFTQGAPIHASARYNLGRLGT